MIVVVTPYQKLDHTHIQRLCAIEPEIDGVIFRTPMRKPELEKWILKLRDEGFPKSKMIVHTDVQLADRLGIYRLHFREGDVEAEHIKQKSPDYRISMSTHSENSIRYAQAQRFDFVLFGHLFPTPSKPNQPPRSSSEIASVLSIDFPIIAIGGIRLETIQNVPTGFSGIACIGSAFSNEIHQFKQMVTYWRAKE
ncbi:thiamine monophosphate synthase [Staphylococcus schleiferi]|uniref:thiamine phosphate synthase n=1 Tax=Staphylococcus coagulans TaxID=74706 RepID=UPI00067AB8AA|nr:thiamine phosphate synthase [Staphylococcus coagulans]BAS46826.1 thiamine monophosphate synthase [Staphylococcus schleiferi]MBA8764021.1 thiamine phosphate synthase [Staphylococcus coagulans]MBT2809597.1 thiamine phosphate synthase [Staphylococcus coagulans]MBT2812344.1 thiamine phosphate synthase [Staphylococcus coagulans]MBT2817876.1 thiamine phosphate synthase [Staphylococcus coagulans]